MTDPNQADWTDAAYSRDTDPSTSHEAAASIPSTTLRQSQFDVLDLFRRYGPMTDRGLLAHARAYKDGTTQSDSGLRTRRAELVKMGKLEWQGIYKTIDGRRHRMWKVV